MTSARKYIALKTSALLDVINDGLLGKNLTHKGYQFTINRAEVTPTTGVVPRRHFHQATGRAGHPPDHHRQPAGAAQPDTQPAMRGRI